MDLPSVAALHGSQNVNLAQEASLSSFGNATSPQSDETSQQSPEAGQHVPQPSSSSATTRIRRRNRMITSCLECRRRKLKCDKSHPCVNCTKFRRGCVFLSKEMDQASQLKLTEIKEKVGSLERLLERDVARTGRKDVAPRGTLGALPEDEADGLPGQEDERDLEPTQLAIVDAAYDEGNEDDDDMLDLGVQVGKLRITERIGGFVRPKFAQELSNSEAYNSQESPPQKAESPPAQIFFASPDYNFLKPGPSYIVPSSGFFFGQGPTNSSLMDYLPSRLAADRLIKQYFDAVHPIARTVHRPTFERDYDAFWEEISLGIEPPPSLQTIIFAALFSGAVSMNESTAFRDFGVSKQSLIDNFKTGAEAALGKSQFLRTTKVATLQGFVMYLIPLCREEVSRAHSVLVGAAIRMAECMGMHRDGNYYGLDAVSTHVRRLIWHQLCFLDIRTCEAQGPRPQIRKEDYDTQLPGNFDDVDLHRTGSPPKAADRWTDVTYSLIRFDIMEMFRAIWVDRPRIERREISITAVLAKIEAFKKSMAEKYDHLIDDRIAIQRAAKVVKALLLSRLHIMLLHRYHNSVQARMPDRLRKLLLTASLTMCETSIMLEMHPPLTAWRWYVGAYTQYHAALLLLVDTHLRGSNVEADRVWSCLDYIFQTNTTRSRQERGDSIMDELRAKTRLYAERRKMRAPPSMQKHVGQRLPAAAHEIASTSVDAASPDTSVQGERVARVVMPVANTLLGRSPHDEINLAFSPHGQYSDSTSQNSASEDVRSRLNTITNSRDAGAARRTSEGSDDIFRTTTAYASPWQGSSATEYTVPALTTTPPQNDLMADIDWDAFDALFPPTDQTMGGLYGEEFSNISFAHY